MAHALQGRYEEAVALALTEDIHLANVVKMGDIYRTYFEQRGFGRDYRVVADDALAPYRVPSGPARSRRKGPKLLEQLALDLGPDRPRWKLSRLVVASAHKERILGHLVGYFTTELGPLEIFVVPIGPAPGGLMRYEAIFN